MSPDLRSALFVALACALLLAACSGKPRAVSKEERGRYLVEEVAKCGDCHTPPGPDGTPDPTRPLAGSKLAFQPLQPVPGWRAEAPGLTRSSPLRRKWGDRALYDFLVRGVGPSGRPAHPPMPSYRLHPDDADAVVAYLGTLP